LVIRHGETAVKDAGIKLFGFPGTWLTKSDSLENRKAIQEYFQECFNNEEVN
jgi:hypothetical protein